MELRLLIKSFINVVGTFIESCNLTSLVVTVTYDRIKSNETGYTYSLVKLLRKQFYTLVNMS